MTTPAKLRQHVRYVKASDGTRLAWAESGTGPLVVKAANWLTHLEYEWESPVWRHWIQFFSAHSRFVRYDAELEDSTAMEARRPAAGERRRSNPWAGRSCATNTV